MLFLKKLYLSVRDTTEQLEVIKNRYQDAVNTTRQSIDEKQQRKSMILESSLRQSHTGTSMGNSPFQGQNSYRY